MKLIYEEDEIKVANILLDLNNLVKSLVSSLTTSWGSKKQRSKSSTNGFIMSCSNSLEGSSKVVDDYKEIKAEAAASPATPLSFSPSESDDKSNNKHSSRKRKTREELLMDMIKQLSQCRESLKGEVENVRNYYNNQKAYNLKLKAMKEQVTRMMNMQGPGLNLGQLYNNPGVDPNHQQPFIMDQIALGSFQYPLGQLQQAEHLFNGLGPMNQMGLGPIGIPDLNVTVDETFMVDSTQFDRMNVERKAQFAAARRRRMVKRIEIKGASGLIRPLRRR